MIGDPSSIEIPVFDEPLIFNASALMVFSSAKPVNNSAVFLAAFSESLSWNWRKTVRQRRACDGLFARRFHRSVLAETGSIDVT
jgi:hypothetical protein